MRPRSPESPASRPPLDDDAIIHRLPYPIAAAWQRVDFARTDDERMRLITHCNEIVLRTLAAFLLPDYLRGPQSAAVEASLKKLGKAPSDGIRAELVRELIKESGPRSNPAPFCPEVFDWYYEAGAPTEPARLMDEVIKIRNKYVHKSTPVVSDEQTRQRAGDCHNWMFKVLSSMGWLVGYRPFRIWSSQATKAGTFVGSVQFLVGDRELNAPQRGEWDLFLVRDSVYLTNPAGTAILELPPFVEILPDPQTESKQERLYLFKEVSSTGQMVHSHDGSGSMISKEIASTQTGRTTFEKWLQQRQSITFFRAVSKSSGIFALNERTEHAGGELGDRFEKLSELGRGGMATVYRVFDHYVNAEVALKVLNAELLQNQAHKKRFFREAADMQRVSHPCVVQVSEVGTLPDGRPFLKMPVKQNGSLQERVVKGGQQEPLVRGWADNALQALQCIHALGIVHRDIKPSNFLIDDDGRAMLTDFGVALAEGDERLTRTMESMGTHTYMAPEQKARNLATPKVDIYSLAVVLHELLTGDLPPGTPGKAIAGPFGRLIERMGQTDSDNRPTATMALAALRRMKRKTGPIAAEVTVRHPPVKGAGSRTPRSGPVFTKPPSSPRPNTAAVIARQIEQQQAVAKRYTVIAAALLMTVFVINFGETLLETPMRRTAWVKASEFVLGDAAQWFEGRLSFEHHDRTNAVGYVGYSIVYFVIFPLLLILTAAAFVMRRDRRPLLLFATAITIDYALTLPFYFLLPMPERWTYDPQVTLLSDQVSSMFIEVFRPISGLNNCFPSFHVSVTVLTVLCLYRYRIHFRTASVPIACAIVLSTFVLGIHWIPDIVAGIGAGVISFWGAERILRRYAPEDALPPVRTTSPLPSHA